MLNAVGSLGVEGDYEGIGRCVLGHTNKPAAAGATRKDNRVFWAW